MQNLAMQRKLAARECIDIRAIGVEIAPGVFELRDFIEDVDYCDAVNERWVWSIGRHKIDGKIFAAFDARFYMNPDYTCLWLR